MARISNPYTKGSKPIPWTTKRIKVFKYTVGIYKKD